MAKLAALLTLLFASVGWGASQQQVISEFGYLNNNEPSVVIGDNEAQDLLNVNVTAGGQSIEKREGYGLYKDLGTGQGIHGAHHFYDATGNDVQIWGSSTSLFGITNDGTPVKLVSSATINTTWDCADTQGFAYCVNSSREALFKTNGSTQTTYSSPLGTMITVTPTRLVVAGVAGTTNNLYFSRVNDFTNFNIGVAATDAFVEPIAAPGSRITNLAYACDRVLWWKDESFGYLLGSEDQAAVSVAIVASNIGSQDNTIAVDPNGIVYFRGQDGHLYSYDCATLSKLSVDITPNVQTSGRRTANSWTLDSEIEFDAGIYSSTTYSTAVSGIVIYNDDDFPDNNFESGNWSMTTNGSSGFFRASYPLLAGHGCAETSGPSGAAGSWQTQFQRVENSSATFNVAVAIVDADTFSVLTSTQVTYVDNDCAWAQQSISGLAPYEKRYVKVQLSTSSTGAYARSPSFALSGDTITFWKRSNGTTIASLVHFDLFENGETSVTEGIYYSPVNNAANLTSWDTFIAGTGGVGGTQTFFIRASTNPFTILSSTPAWVSQSNGAVVATSTGTYFQYKDSFTVVAASQTPRLQSTTINWFEGAAGDQAYSVYFDNAVWWSVAFGDGVSVNNYIFRYDLLRPGFGLYDFGAGGFLIQNNNLYFGEVTGDQLFRYGGSFADNGAAIESFWKSKDFPGGDPWLDNSYKNLDVYANRNDGNNLTVTYSVGTSTSTGSYSISLSSVTSSIVVHKKNLPVLNGPTFSVKVGDESTSSAWEIMGIRFSFDPLAYKPSP